MARIRTFIAVELPKAIRDKAIALQNRLAENDTGDDVKWVEAANLHVTLLFLGEVSDREIATVCKLTAECTLRHPSFAMSVETVGSFPNLHRPRIIWVGIGEGAQSLTAIHDELENPFADLGYRREERRYTPHITLGRVKTSGSGLSAAIAEQAKWKGGETQVRELHVMSSELSSRGPTYTVLGRCPLA